MDQGIQQPLSAVPSCRPPHSMGAQCARNTPGSRGQLALDGRDLGTFLTHSVLSVDITLLRGQSAYLSRFRR